MQTLQSCLGVVVFVALAWLCGENRRAARLKVALAGIMCQLGLALVILKVPLVKTAFSAANHAVLGLQTASEAGTSLVFGYLGGGPLPFEETQPGASFVFAFRALPIIIIVSALTAVLTYWRVLPWIVRGLSRVLERAFGLSGAVGLSVAANIFVGMVEGPTFVRPYLARMTRSDLFVLMTAGMASIAGTVLVLYATLIGPVVPDAAGHLLAASFMSAPAAITIALLMVPETQPRDPATSIERTMPERGATSTMDAVTRGTEAGLQLFLTVVAMLLVLVALVALVNGALGFLPDLRGQPLSMQRMLGWLMAPVTWLMGIPWSETPTAGALMGTKTVLNEFIAYLDMSRLPAGTLSPRSQLIMTYALCGFANFGSLGILLGGLSTLVPERRADIVSLGTRSIVAGTLSTCLMAAAVGVF
jgi:CNT family concentrative nucleoside transporter